MITAIFVLIVLLAAAALLLLVAFLRAAAGSPDCNGDPERDSGMSDDEIARAWDRGSSQTEYRPNLSYARRLNREHLRRSISQG